MKKAFLLLSAVLLAGAGCTSTVNTSVDANVQPDMNMDTNDQGTEQIQIDGNASGDVDLGNDMIDTQVDAGANADVSAPLNISMSTGNFFFQPNTINAEPGQTVNVTFSSNDGFHTFVIDAINLKKSVAAGETVTFTAPTTPGSYEFYCDVGSHKAMGMKGTLVVK